MKGIGASGNSPQKSNNSGSEKIRYFRSDLKNPENRDRIARELQNQRWIMAVMKSRFLENNNFCFLKHSQFSEDVFLSALNIPPGMSLTDGDEVEVIVSIKNDTKKGQWGYAAKVIRKCNAKLPSASEISQISKTTAPKWHNAWNGVLTALILYSKDMSNATTLESLLKKVSQSGAPVEGLSSFNFSPANANRLIMAKNIVGRLIGGVKTTDCAVEYQRVFNVNEKAWQTLKKLADARLAAEGIIVDEITKKVRPGNRKTGGRKPWKKLSQKRIKKAPPPSAADRLKQLESQKLAVPSASNFGQNDAFMSIYIDEAWPSEEKNKGVIGGIVWRGPKPDYDILQHVRTHRRATATGIYALNLLLGCTHAFPFIMPIEASGKIAQKDYFDLVISALKVLLGWLLPQQGEKCKIRILLERFSDILEGTECTDYLRGVFEEARLINPQRFSRWQLEMMRWSTKEEEYVPYADLVSFLGLEHHEINIELGRKADYRNWPGYVPLSLELIPRLTRLDQLESTGNVDDVLDFVNDMHGTELGNVVSKDLKLRMAGRPDLQRKLVERLEIRYEHTARDISALRNQTEAVKMLVPVSDEKMPTRQKLLWWLIDIQHANHHGNPAKAFQSAENYSRLRLIVQPHDRELVAYSDLNLAVHFNDQFKFHEALLVNQSLREDPGFDHLSPLFQGRILSSLGQTYSLTGQYAESEECFAGALALLENALTYDQSLGGDIDQSRIYRAINALDGGFDEAAQRVAESLGNLSPEFAAKMAQSAAVDEQYRHHLLLRSLWILENQEAVIMSYLGQRSHWKTNPSHPWELIKCYRALLLWSGDDENLHVEAANWFDEAIAITQQEEHGVTMHLIGAMIATIAACCLDDENYVTSARKLTEDVDAKLPAAAQPVAVLRGIIDNPNPEHIDSALAALPFNYH
jgi:hypothetical protein